MKGLDIESTPDPADRRRDVRISVPADLKMESGSPRMRARVLDISECGALIESNLPFAVGPDYRLTFRLGSFVTECQATAAHCRRLENGRWLVGLNLTSPHTPSPLANLIDLITERAIQFS